jgi:hypothetical protein
MYFPSGENTILVIVPIYFKKELTLLIAMSYSCGEEPIHASIYYYFLLRCKLDLSEQVRTL